MSRALRAYVDSQREELADLAAIPVRQRRLEEFTRQAEETIEIPLQRLERALRLYNLEPVRSLMLMGSFASPFVLDPALHAAGATPHEAVATGVVAAIGAAWWSVRQNRADAREHSPVAYLLDVRDALTPHTLAGGINKFLRGTMRIAPSGRCLSPRCSWLVPLLVQAAAVLGVAAASRSIPHPEPGRWQSARRRATASSGRSAA
jgi:hypothetical protein